MKRFIQLTAAKLPFTGNKLHPDKPVFLRADLISLAQRHCGHGDERTLLLAGGPEVYVNETPAEVFALIDAAEAAEEAAMWEKRISKAGVRSAEEALQVNAASASTEGAKNGKEPAGVHSDASTNPPGVPENSKGLVGEAQTKPGG